MFYLCLFLSTSNWITWKDYYAVYASFFSILSEISNRNRDRKQGWEPQTDRIRNTGKLSRIH